MPTAAVVIASIAFGEGISPEAQSRKSLAGIEAWSLALDWPLSPFAKFGAWSTSYHSPGQVPCLWRAGHAAGRRSSDLPSLSAPASLKHQQHGALITHLLARREKTRLIEVLARVPEENSHSWAAVIFTPMPSRFPGSQSARS